MTDLTSKALAAAVLSARTNVGSRLRAHVAGPVIEDLQQAIASAIREAERDAVKYALERERNTGDS